MYWKVILLFKILEYNVVFSQVRFNQELQLQNSLRGVDLCKNENYGTCINSKRESRGAHFDSGELNPQHNTIKQQKKRNFKIDNYFFKNYYSVVGNRRRKSVKNYLHLTPSPLHSFKHAILELRPDQVNKQYINQIIGYSNQHIIPHCSKTEYEAVEKWQNMELKSTQERWHQRAINNEKQRINTERIPSILGIGRARRLIERQENTSKVAQAAESTIKYNTADVKSPHYIEYFPTPSRTTFDQKYKEHNNLQENVRISRSIPNFNRQYFESDIPLNDGMNFPIKSIIQANSLGHQNNNEKDPSKVMILNLNEGNPVKFLTENTDEVTVFAAGNKISPKSFQLKISKNRGLCPDSRNSLDCISHDTNCQKTTLDLENFKEVHEAYRPNNEACINDIYWENPKWLKEYTLGQHKLPFTCTSPTTPFQCPCYERTSNGKRDTDSLPPVIVMYPMSEEGNIKDSLEFESNINDDTSILKDGYSAAIENSNKKVENRILEGFISSIIANYSQEMTKGTTEEPTDIDNSETAINLLKDFVNRKSLEGSDMNLLPIIIPESSLTRFSHSDDYEKYGPFDGEFIRSILPNETDHLTKRK